MFSVLVPVILSQNVAERFFISCLSSLQYVMHENESFLTSLRVRVWHLQVYQSIELQRSV